MKKIISSAVRATVICFMVCSAFWIIQYSIAIGNGKNLLLFFAEVFPMWVLASFIYHMWSK